MKLFLVYVACIVTKVTTHDFEWDSFQEDFYTEDNYEMHRVRICTKCSEQHPSCMTDAENIYNKNKKDSEEPDSYPDLFDPSALAGWKLKLVENNLKLSCWSDSDMDETDDASKPSQRTHEAKIFINRAYYGKDFNQNCDLSTEFDFCFLNAFHRRYFYGLCNGQNECELYGLPSHVPQCNRVSDFLHVDYQCIPENQIYNIGEYSSSEGHNSSYGYIISPNFPYAAPVRSSFECMLEIYDTTVHGKITLTNLDFHLRYGNGWGCCNREYVEVQSIQDDTIVFRKRYCGHVETGDMLTVDGTKMRIVFVTDTHQDWREHGFWAKYQGFNNATGMPVQVNVECGFFDPYNEVKLAVAPGIQTFEGEWCTEDYDNEDDLIEEEGKDGEESEEDDGIYEYSTTSKSLKDSDPGSSSADKQVTNLTQKSGNNKTIPIAAGVASSLLIAVVIAVVIYFYRKRLSSNRETKNLDRRIEICNQTNVTTISKQFQPLPDNLVTNNRTEKSLPSVPQDSLPKQTTTGTDNSVPAGYTENQVYHNASSCTDSPKPTNIGLFDDDTYEMLPDCEQVMDENEKGSENAIDAQFKAKNPEVVLRITPDTINDDGYTSLQHQINDDYIVLAEQS